MSVPETTSAEVIADRYLTSPAGLRSRPFGPVDALDTHAGRAAQVRLVFLCGEWDGEAVAERVAAWCAIGTAGVIGVLDFGMHEGRAFVVLAPSIGVPLERWRAMRRPSGLDAASLTLGFGRLVEAVAEGGFGVGAAEPGDFAVGPGPTPFLDVPLLGRVQRDDARESGAAQQLMANLFRAISADPSLPAELAAWADRASAAGFRSVGACLDALELAASAVHETGQDAEPVGIAGVFDRPLEPPAPSGKRSGTAARLSTAVAAVAAVVCIAGALSGVVGARHAASQVHAARSPEGSLSPAGASRTLPRRGAATKPRTGPKPRRTPRQRHRTAHHKPAKKQTRHHAAGGSSAGTTPAATSPTTPAAPYSPPAATHHVHTDPTGTLAVGGGPSTSSGSGSGAGGGGSGAGTGLGLAVGPG